MTPPPQTHTHTGWYLLGTETQGSQEGLGRKAVWDHRFSCWDVGKGCRTRGWSDGELGPS